MIEVGDVFDRLKVIADTGKRSKNRNKIWLCECQCGKLLEVPTNSLTTKNTRSCGCLHKEITSKIGKNTIYNINPDANKGNKYDLTGEYGIGYLPDNRGEFYFDLEDYDLIKDYTWNCKDDGDYSYITTRRKNKNILMHRLILQCFDRSKDIDHINHNVKDNRKENLRICEHYKNITASKTYTNNTSGKKGVHWDNSRNKWVAVITYNKKTWHLGRYEGFEDAVKAREKAEEEIHKEFHFNDDKKE